MSKAWSPWGNTTKVYVVGRSLRGGMSQSTESRRECNRHPRSQVSLRRASPSLYTCWMVLNGGMSVVVDRGVSWVGLRQFPCHTFRNPSSPVQFYVPSHGLPLSRYSGIFWRLFWPHNLLRRAELWRYCPIICWLGSCLALTDQ